MKSQNSNNKNYMDNNLPSQDEIRMIEELFPIEKNVIVPIAGKRNPYCVLLLRQVYKMKPNERISISVIQLNSYKINLQSLRSLITQDINLKGRISIRSVKNIEGNPVSVNLCCIA